MLAPRVIPAQADLPSALGMRGEVAAAPGRAAPAAVGFGPKKLPKLLSVSAGLWPAPSEGLGDLIAIAATTNLSDCSKLRFDRQQSAGMGADTQICVQ